MARFFKTSKAKKRIIAVLAVAMAASLSAGFLTACNTSTSDDDDDEQESVVKTDTQLIKNGNFEFYTESTETDLNEKRILINSVNNWTNSYTSAGGSTAPSSEAKSGIVNTAEWEYLTQPGRAFTDTEDALANWEDEDVHAYDRLKFYEDNAIDSDDDFDYYSDYTYSIDYDDVKEMSLIANPLTHDTSDSEDKETSILMIQNRKITSSQVYGTGQKYASSTTVTVKAGSAAKLSVWVKTDALVHNNALPVEEGAGAIIAVTNMLGGTSLPQLQIKNINTQKQGADVSVNNGWVQYTLYVRANSFATTTFKVDLGLGLGSTADAYEMVNGFAFFDDLACEVITDAEYQTATAGLLTCTADSTASQKKFNADVVSDKAFALDLSSTAQALPVGADNFSADVTTESANGQTYSPEDYGLVFNKSNDFVAVDTVTNFRNNSNATLQSILASDFARFDEVFGDDTQTIMLMSASGAPYTATVANSTAFTLAPDKKMLVSFFMKTSDMEGFAGGGVSVVDLDTQTKTSISPFDTNTVDKVNYNDENKDVYDGWVQCFFFVSNNATVDKTFALQFNYGTLTVIGAAQDSYIDGYAAFTNFEMCELDSYEYSYATTGTYAMKATLSEASTVTNGTKFDNVVMNDPDSIETDLATPANYWGIQGGDERVGGDQGATTPGVTPDGVTAGLLNKKHVANYTSLNAFALESILGDATQPVGIFNTATPTRSYGYVATTMSSFSSSSTTLVSVRVKVSAGAKAYVYLVSDELTDDLTPDLPKLTFWYDDKGNVTLSDPTDEEYDKSTGIAYTLGNDGLYTNAKDTTDTKKYANLANYKEADNGDLVTEDDTVVYYKHDNKYYAYYNEETQEYTQEVFQLDASIARYDYTAYQKAASTIVVDGTDATVADKWVTVNFYVKRGNTAQSYRLEVWSGSRDNSVINGANSYVLFDAVVTETSSSYETLLSAAVSATKDSLGIADKDKLPADVAQYYTYTFYDDPDYIRYDETTDTEEEGNRYSSYKQSAKTEGIAYFTYDDRTLESEPNFRTFIDYSLSDVTVTPDATDDDTTEDTEDTTTAETSIGDILIFGSSIALVIALAIVIVSILLRKFLKKRNARKPVYSKVKPKKAKKAKPVEVEEDAPVEVDEDNPYNE